MATQRVKVTAEHCLVSPPKPELVEKKLKLGTKEQVEKREGKRDGLARAPESYWLAGSDSVM